MSNFRILATVLVAAFAFGQQTAGQNVNLTISLFERYLGALREQAGIPGLAATIVQNGNVVWERGFGFANLDGLVEVRATTPFPINDMSQVVAASLVLQQCIDRGEVELEDIVQRWSPTFADRTATFRQVLSNVGPGGYSYNTTRFGGLTGAIEECSDRRYFVTMVQEVLDRFVMTNSVPGGDVAVNGSDLRLLFPTPKLDTYKSILQQMAVPYRVDSNRRPTRSANYRVASLSATNGLVASVHDLALFDRALDAGMIVSRRTLEEQAWTRQGVSPMGLGWFVQQVGSHRVAWQFGQATGAYSSLIIKVPFEHVTLILLANSDGLSAPYPLANGDVRVSPFAQIFFSLLG